MSSIKWKEIDNPNPSNNTIVIGQPNQGDCVYVIHNFLGKEDFENVNNQLDANNSTYVE